MGAKTVLVTGANGYIGKAVACAFVRAGWVTYGLIRSVQSSTSLTAEEIIPIIGSIDDVASHKLIGALLPSTLDVIASTTENTLDYVPHFQNIVSLLQTLSVSSTENGVRPLVIFTAGSKDYGVGPHLSDDPDVAPHDELSELRPPPFAAPRVQHAPRIFDSTNAFAAVLVRPTNVYGRASSYYSVCFRAGSRAASAENPRDRILIAPAQPSWICHSLHIDDCAEAYVAIASAPRQTVEGEVFNISSERYETAEQIINAIIKEYDIAGGVKYVNLKSVEAHEHASLAMAIGFPQWTSSKKLRMATGWTDHRLPFSSAFHLYRLSYEAAAQLRDENVGKIGKTINSLMSTVESV